MSLPTIEPRKRRVGRKRREAQAAPPAPPAGLNITAITDVNFGGDVLSFVVVFDTTESEPLVNIGAADPLKWTARYNGALFEASSLAQTNYDMIEVGMMVIGAEAGANVVNYSNAPSDIQDALGRQLAALTGLPLA